VLDPLDRANLNHWITLLDPLDRANLNHWTTLLGPLDRANLNHWSSVKVQKASSSQCYIPSSEAFRFY
jgi:hypothetical protein